MSMQVSLLLFLEWLAVASALWAAALIARMQIGPRLRLAGIVLMLSLGTSLLAQVAQPNAMAVKVLFALGACATCNMIWLVARLLFRGEQGVSRRHLAFVVLIALLIVAYKLSALLGAESSQVRFILADILVLLSSTTLVLSFLEAARFFGQASSVQERALSALFMSVFGAAVAVNTITESLVKAGTWLPMAKQYTVALAAVSVIWMLVYVLRQRGSSQQNVSLEAAPSSADHRHHPERISSQSMAPPCALKQGPSEEDQALAQAVLKLLEREHVYRNAELKVIDLARSLSTSEHKISRAITQAGLAPNFNQLINRYRIDQAKKALEDIRNKSSVLAIGMSCGFASIGPFNRAFKSMVGSTPSAYRSARRALPEGASPLC
jgi:AraC-like DNA-binding protein